MGGSGKATLDEEIAPFATRRLSVAELLPDARWPQQIEIQAGKHVVRPRYEVTSANGRMRISHPNVERSDLKPEPALQGLGAWFGKGFILPAPVLPPGPLSHDGAADADVDHANASAAQGAGL